MFTLTEKQYLLKLLTRKKCWGWLFGNKISPIEQQLIEKLQQMIRNEVINQH